MTGEPTRRDVIVVGASAGGVEALRALVAGLPRDLPACVLVVLHVPPYGGSVLPDILSRAQTLPARHAKSGDPLLHGEILVAPPDAHLVVNGDHVLLTRGPRENGHRPAVDVLFRTAAHAVGPRAVGVVLSGVLDDGTAGLASIHSRGGVTIVQEPSDATYPAMPQNALAHVPVDHVAAASQIGKLLMEVCTEEVTVAPSNGSDLVEFESSLAMMNDNAMNNPDRPGRPAGFSCPDCAGTLFEIDDGTVVRYRCRVGHAWSAETLLGEQGMQLETALWMALRSLEEKAALSKTLCERAEQKSHTLTASRFRDQAAEATRAATLVRSLLESHLGAAEAHGG